SLLTGIAALEESNARSTPPGLSAGGQHPGFFLAFADQPAVAPATLAALARAFFENPGVPIVLPTFLGKKGHPVVLSTALIPAIRAIPPGGTLRTVVQQHLSEAILIAVSDSAVLEDLDTPQDFVRAE